MSEFVCGERGAFDCSFFAGRLKKRRCTQFHVSELFMVFSLSLLSALNAVGAFPASLYGPIRPLAPRMEVRYG